MLDIRYIRDNSDRVKKAIQDKGINLDLDQLLSVDIRRRELLQETEALQATKRAASKEMPKLSEADKKVKLLEMKEVDSRQSELESSLVKVIQEYEGLLAIVPNIPSPESPIGPDESANVPFSYWGPKTGHVEAKDSENVAKVPTHFDFAPKSHIELGLKLDLLDFEAGSKTSGSRGYYLKNELVWLYWGVLQFGMKKLRDKHFNFLLPPVLLREFALFGSGHFPAGREEVYQVQEARVEGKEIHKEPVYLAGTSEPSLLAYYSDKVLDESELPIKVAALTPCYRSEIGGYGKDTKGLYRVHEFFKVEQVVLSKADSSEAEQLHEELRSIAEEILQDLKLPYRVLNISTGDMGAGKYKMYDIETWMPSRSEYGETHSDSNLTDWQARRLNIKYKDSEGNIRFVYTLNNTAVALPRLLIAILENYQQADGSIKIPDVLKPFVGFDKINTAPSTQTTPEPKAPEAPKSTHAVGPDTETKPVSPIGSNIPNNESKVTPII